MADKYAKLRRRLPTHKNEVKGRLLSDSELIAVLEILRRSNCLFEVCVVNTSLHSTAEFESHRSGQAQNLIAGLGAMHHPELVAKVHSFRDQLLRMNEPQYLQAILTFLLVSRVVEISTNYYALRQPKELAAFRWVIDAKDRRRETDWETWWKEVILAWLQTHSLTHPMAMMDFADYRYFERFNSTIPEYLPAEFHGESATNLRLLLTEHFRFSSNAEHGLELVDIVTNGLRRALVGHVGRSTWPHLKSLFVNGAEGSLGLHTPGPSITLAAEPGGIFEYLRTGGRSMLPDRQYREDR